MPYQVTIDESTRTIFIRGHGAGSTSDTLKLITEHQDTFRRYPGFNLLYDTSALDIQSSPADMLKVANALFEQSSATFGRIAIVVPEVREQLARIFTALAHPHGIDANVFSNTDDARRWLRITG